MAPAKHKQIKKKIDKYLAKRKKLRNGSATVDPGEVKELENIIHLLIKAKYQLSAYGDLPVEFIVVDRTTHESISYFPVPYQHKLDADNPRELESWLRAVAWNSTIHGHRLQEAVGWMLTYLSCKADDQEKKGKEG